MGNFIAPGHKQPRIEPPTRSATVLEGLLTSFERLTAGYKNLDDADHGRWRTADYGDARVDVDPPENVVELGDRLKNGNHDGIEFEEFEIPITELTATQEKVHEKKVEKMRGGDNGGIMVVDHDGVNYVVDGHHRLAASVADGKTGIGCRVCSVI